jgi:hypothetical protein
LNVPGLQSWNCPSEVAIYVHGVWVNEGHAMENAIERTMQYIKDRQNALMTISLAERRIVNYYMCGIG